VRDDGAWSMSDASRDPRTRQDVRVMEMSRERFEELVSDALDRVPPELAVLMSNVVVLVEDEPPPDDPDLLGLYDGTPLTERDSTYAGVLPDRILVFRNPTLDMCGSEEEVVEEVHITVVHEIAHHFGIDDTRLHDLGYA
jgi:predicted Zn-dependent protease with MMP-like domain